MKASLCFLFFFCLAGGFSFSQTTIGPNNPSAAVDGGGGTGGVPIWNIASGTPYSSDNGYAFVVDQTKNKNTNYLHITGLGFAVPAGSYISGIKVEVEMYGTIPVGAINKESSILLINSAGTRVGTDHATLATIATADPNSYVTYGSSSDNWGGSLTYADVNSVNFGVAIQYLSGSLNDTAGNYDFYVDHVRVTVTYTTGYDATVNGCFNDGATWGRVSPGAAGIDYPDATIAASIPGGRTVTVCSGTTANCYALIMNSNLSTTTGATLTLADATSILNVADDILMLTSTAISASFAAGTINITGGTITTTDDLVMTADRNGGFVTTQSIEFSGGTMTVNGSVTMSSDQASATTTLNMTAANSVFNLGRDLSLGLGASLTNGVGATGTVNYKGTGTQIVRGAITYFNLTYSGGGLKSLDAATTVKGTFNMTSGSCDMGGLTLILGASTAAIGTLSYTSGALYNGTFFRWFNTATIADGAVAGLFPVGTSTDYRPFYIYWPTTGPSAGGTLSMRHTDPGTGSVVVSFADGASTVVRRTSMTWLLTAANAFNIAINNLNTRIEGTNIGSIGNVNDLRITLVGSVIGTAGTNGGTTSNPIVKRTSLPAFTATSNTFYIGSVDAVSSPLPIELINFDALLNKNRNEVNLTWSTASELNNDFFTIERTHDLEKFEEVITVKGQGTVNSKSNYTSIDDSPLPGKSYYRLKQTDFDGQFTYSELRKIENADIKTQFKIYPNPVVDRKFNFELTGIDPGMEVPLRIVNVQGTSVFEASYKADQSGRIKTTVELNLVSNGMYMVIINTANGLRRKILIP